MVYFNQSESELAAKTQSEDEILNTIQKFLKEHNFNKCLIYYEKGESFNGQYFRVLINTNYQEEEG